MESGELDLVHRFWPKAFISERFILDSRDAYPLPWMIREIVQNFLDHGKKLSLDDVTLDIRGGPLKQIVITGAWQFPSRGPVLALHGTKGREDAGANAIGLKQVLIRCCRDFGVTRFTIEGDGWDVNYHLAAADEINARLAKDGDGRVQYGWLVPEEVGAARREHYCRYVIETANPELIAAFADFFDLGVHSNNPFLKPAAFVNDFGALKWRADNSPGRIFIKGQVMNFRRAGKGADFWQGPEGVSVSLPKAEYRKSIDRPAINEFELALLATPLIQSMSKEALIAQLKASSHLWSRRNQWAGHADEKFPGSTFGFVILVRKMVDELQSSAAGLKKVTLREYQDHFGDHKYVCLDQKADDEQAKELEERGFHVCPGFFERIGMARVSDQFDSITNAKRHQPDPTEVARSLDRLARDKGIPVGFDAVEVNTPADFLQLIMHRIQPFVNGVTTVSGTVLRIAFRQEIPKELLSHPLHSARSEPQEMLYGCRTVIAVGLRTGICTSAFIAQRTQGSTFALGHDAAVDQDLLISATVDIEQPQGTFLDLDFESGQFAYFRDQLVAEYRSNRSAMPNLPGQSTQEVGGARIVDVSAVGAVQYSGKRPQEREPHSALSSLRIALGAVSIAIVATIWLLFDQRGPSPTVQFPAVESASSTSATTRELDAAIEQLSQVVQSSYTRGTPTQLAENATQQPGLSMAIQEGGKSVSQITAEHNRARIQPLDLADDERARRLLAIQDVVSNAMDRVAADLVADFAIVDAPLQGQLEKLEALREYVRLTTGADVSNPLFLYTGKGHKGINIEGVGIGIHLALLDAPFSEAVGTFVHEVAHNDAGHHGTRFEKSLQALFAAMNTTLIDIAQKADSGVTLSAEERAVIDSAAAWRL